MHDAIRLRLAPASFSLTNSHAACNFRKNQRLFSKERFPMPAKDMYHDAVERALEKDGWMITHDPFIIEFKGLRLYADLGAEQVMSAEKAGRKIVIEIKVFGTASLVSELEKAVGQYSIYRTFLRRVNPEYELYLAIPERVHQAFFAGQRFKKSCAIIRFVSASSIKHTRRSRNGCQLEISADYSRRHAATCRTCAESWAD